MSDGKPVHDEFFPTAPAGRSAGAIARLLVVALVVLLSDLGLKQWAFEHVAGRPVHLTRENARSPDVIPPHRGVHFVANVLDLKLTLNQGAVFGLGQGGRWFFIAVTVIAVVVILGIFSRSQRHQWMLHVALGLILAGALGNLHDRFWFGAVRDMLYLFPGVYLPFGWHWPGGNTELYPWIFNLADAGLCVGVTLVVVLMLRKPRTHAE